MWDDQSHKLVLCAGILRGCEFVLLLTSIVGVSFDYFFIQLMSQAYFLMCGWVGLHALVIVRRSNGLALGHVRG